MRELVEIGQDHGREMIRERQAEGIALAKQIPGTYRDRARKLSSE